MIRLSTILSFAVLGLALHSAAQDIHTAHGVMVGEVDETSAILQSRLSASKGLVNNDVPGAAGVGRFEISDTRDFRDIRFTEWMKADAEGDFVLKTKVADLKPATRYFYRLAYGANTDSTRRSRVGTFKTLQGRQGAGEVSFVVVTGMNYNSFHYGVPRKGKRSGERMYTGPDKHLGFPALETMRKMKPDFFVGTGDNVYYDSHDEREATDAPNMRRMWHEQLVQPRFVDFLSEVATYWEKDDHDHRFNDCDREGNRPPTSDLGIALFREQVPVVDPKDPNAKTYRTYRASKHLQIWLVEGRDYRSPNKMDDGPQKTLWGAEQIAWLKRTLMASDATYKILISPTPMVGPDDAYKRDNHTNHKGFRTEGRAFFQWIKEQGLDKKGFYLVCGDRHWQYHSADPTGIEEFSSGALVDANSRLGRKPGDPKSTDPKAEINQFYTQKYRSGGFLRVAVSGDESSADANFEFYDENGDLLYQASKFRRLARKEANTGRTLRETAIGVTGKGGKLKAFVDDEAHDPAAKKYRVLLVGGLDGDPASVEAVRRAMSDYLSGNSGKGILLSAIPNANPDGEEVNFPPGGKAYNVAKTQTAHYLWRWIGMQAPDLVFDVRAARSDKSSSVSALTKALNAGGASGFGEISALVKAIEPGSEGRALRQSLRYIQINPDRYKPGPGTAREEAVKRAKRQPLELAHALLDHYGKQLNSVAYIPALAVVARHRMAGLTDKNKFGNEVARVVEPYESGTKSTFGKRVSGSSLSGHLIFGELSRVTVDKRFGALILAAADKAFDSNGKPLPSMPFHNEMSDSVFMGCPILAEAARLTGERKYMDACFRHLRFMQKLCLREDGIYRHSPLDEAAWGRGNGFPALGLAWTLSCLPESYPGRPEILKAFREHLNALLPHQDASGMWHQVIDRPESYREFTSTCMISYAMLRGMREGWLPREKYQPAVRKAWRAIVQRVDLKGHGLVDVCTGTGKQKNLQAYFLRTAILGPDDRGGAMALMFATEMAAYQMEKEN